MNNKKICFICEKEIKDIRKAIKIIISLGTVYFCKECSERCKGILPDLLKK